MLSSNKSSLSIPGFLHRPHQVRPRVQGCPVAIGNKTATAAGAVSDDHDNGFPQELLAPKTLPTPIATNKTNINACNQ